GINIAQHLGLGRFPQFLRAPDVELRAQLFSLIAVENTQRDTDADADGVNGKRIVSGRVVGIPAAQRRVRRAIGDRQLVLGLSLVHSLNGSPQVRPSIECDLPEFIARLQLVAEIIAPSYVELLDRSAVVKQG